MRGRHGGTPGHRLVRAARGLGAVTAVAAGLSAAAASGVGASGSVTVQLSSTAATATQVTYTAGFVAPATMTAGTTTITLTAPSGTVFPAGDCLYTVTDERSTQVSACPAVVGGGGDSVTVTTGVAVAPGDPVTVVAEGVTNTTAGSYSLGVSTSNGASLSGAFSLTAPTAVGNFGFQANSTSAGASGVLDTASFTATNALTPGTSQITITGPGGTVFPDNGCDYAIADGRTTQSNGCPDVAPTAAGNAVAVTLDIVAYPGDPLTVSVQGVTNPGSAGTDTVSLATTSDPVTVTAPFSVTTPTAVSDATLTSDAADATATEVADTLTFTSTNGMTDGASQILVTTPTGTVFPDDDCDYTVSDARTAQAQGCVPVQVSGGGDTVAIGTGLPVAAGDRVTVTVDGVADPATAGKDTVTLSTTADPTAVHLADTITAASPVKGLSFAVAAAAAGATAVTYTASFTAVHGLTADFSQVTLVAPAGTVFAPAGCGVYVVTDDTTSQSGSCLSATVSASGSSVTVTAGTPVAPGNTVTVTAGDVTNTATTGSGQVAVSTTSDPVPVDAAVTITKAGAVKQLTFSADADGAGATQVQYTTQFTAVGGLSPAFAGITLVAPAGTVFPAAACGVYVVTDDTTDQSDACLSATVSDGGSTVDITPGVTIASGDAVTVTVSEVANPRAKGSDELTVTTTSNSVAATAKFTVTAATALKGVSLSATSYAEGATDVTYTLTFTVVGALQADQSTVTVDGPAGTVFPENPGCGVYVNENDDTGASWACAGGAPSANGSDVVVTPDEDASAGDQFTLTINGVTNPTTTGKETLTVQTSSDTAAVSVPVTYTAATSVTAATFTPSSSSATATQVSYDLSFTVTGGLTQGFSTITVATPAGTVLPAAGCGTYTVTDTTDGQSGDCGNVTLSNGGATATLTAPVDVRPGDSVSVVVDGAANPPTAGTGLVIMGTSSDTVATFTLFPVTAPTAVTDASLAVQGTSAPYTLTVGFTATNGLTGGSSTVTVAAPSGTALPGGTCGIYTVTDTTDGQSGTCGNVVLSSNGASATLTVPVGVRPGDDVTITVDGVTGTKPDEVAVSTSSDPVATAT